MPSHDYSQSLQQIRCKTTFPCQVRFFTPLNSSGHLDSTDYYRYFCSLNTRLFLTSPIGSAGYMSASLGKTISFKSLRAPYNSSVAAYNHSNHYPKGSYHTSFFLLRSSFFLQYNAGS